MPLFAGSRPLSAIACSVAATLAVAIATVSTPAAAGASAYDYVLQIKDGTSKQIKLYGADSINSEELSVPPADLDPAADEGSTSLCVLGPFDAGKTLLANSFLGTSLPSGTNYSTVGVSWKTEEIHFGKRRMRVTVYDFAGFGLPASTADGKRRLAFTENLLDDIAAQLSCLPVIVVPKLTEAARENIDSLTDHIFQVRSQRIREATNGKSSLNDLHVVVVVNNRLAKANSQLYQEMTMSHVPLEPTEPTEIYAHSSASNATATDDEEAAILHLSRRTESVKWRGSERLVKFHVAFLRNVDDGEAFSKQLLENTREFVLSQAGNHNREKLQKEGLTGSIVEAVKRSTKRLNGAESVNVSWTGTGNLNETLENYKGAASASAFINPLANAVANFIWGGVIGFFSGRGGGDSDASAATSHRQYYRGTFELDYDGNPVSWQFRYGVGTRQVVDAAAGEQRYDVFRVQIVAPGCGYSQAAFQTDDQRSFVEVSCSLAADEEWNETLAASPVGRSEWLIDYYQGYPFCPNRTVIANGIISLFFGTPHACSLIGSAGELPKKVSEFEERPVGRDSKGSSRSKVLYLHPGNVTWTVCVAALLDSEGSPIVWMLIAAATCLAGVFSTARAAMAFVHLPGAGPRGFATLEMVTVPFFAALVCLAPIAWLVKSMSPAVE